MRTRLTRSQLILLPGLVCDAAVWEHASTAFAMHADVHIGAYDSLDSLPAMAARILSEVDGDFALAGHSMGGRIALEIFREAPQRVTGIALLDTGTQPLAPGSAGERETAGRFELLEIARKSGMVAMADRWVRGMVWPPRLADAPLVTAIVDMFARSTAELFAAQIRALLARPDAGDLLPRIECPALVLCGLDDAWAPAARHRDMAAAILNSRLELIPDCGHMCTLERPAAVTQALLEWHASVRGAQSPASG